MATKPEKKQNLADALRERNYVQPGSKEHERLLETGYNMTLEEANMIVTEWNKDHKLWPLEEYRKAKAMIDASKAVPVAIDTDPGWHRERVE